MKAKCFAQGTYLVVKQPVAQTVHGNGTALYNTEVDAFHSRRGGREGWGRAFEVVLVDSKGDNMADGFYDIPGYNVERRESVKVNLVVSEHEGTRYTGQKDDLVHRLFVGHGLTRDYAVCLERIGVICLKGVADEFPVGAANIDLRAERLRTPRVALGAEGLQLEWRHVDGFGWRRGHLHCGASPLPGSVLFFFYFY
jgi:hypothetical protein